MKTLILIMSTIALGLMGVGCSKSNSNSGDVNAAATTTGGTVVNPVVGNDLSGSTNLGNSTVTFTPASLSAMNSYASIPGNLVALNNPQNIQISFNLSQSEAGRYGGDVTISYIDNGVQHYGTFHAGLGRNQTFKGMYDNNTLEANYNYFFNLNSQLVFTGFFEDSFGAITLTLTPEVTAGGGNDAEPLNVTYKGSVYFKNYKAEKTSPYRACWFIYNNGVGDCRSNVIQTKCGLAPGSETGYALLRTFTNVNIKQAFNMN
jgi:hypothetical protein